MGLSCLHIFAPGWQAKRCRGCHESAFARPRGRGRGSVHECGGYRGEEDRDKVCTASSGWSVVVACAPLYFGVSNCERAFQAVRRMARVFMNSSKDSNCDGVLLRAPDRVRVEKRASRITVLSIILIVEHVDNIRLSRVRVQHSVMLYIVSCCSCSRPSRLRIVSPRRRAATCSIYVCPTACLIAAARPATVDSFGRTCSVPPWNGG